MLIINGILFRQRTLRVLMLSLDEEVRVFVEMVGMEELIGKRVEAEALLVRGEGVLVEVVREGLVLEEVVGLLVEVVAVMFQV